MINKENRIRNFKVITFIAFAAFFLMQESYGQIGVEDKRNSFNNRRFYARTTRLRNNFAVLQVAQLPFNFRVSYERRLNVQFIVGIHMSVRFTREEAGTLKSEVYAKYFTNQRAPQGLYIFGETGLARLNNYTVYKLLDGNALEPGTTLPASGDFATMAKKANFFSFCLGAGFGFQNAFGAGRRTLLDFAVGYRWYSIPDDLKKTEISSENGLPYTEVDKDVDPLSPLSPFTFRLGVGYLF